MPTSSNLAILESFAPETLTNRLPPCAWLSEGDPEVDVDPDAVSSLSDPDPDEESTSKLLELLYVVLHIFFFPPSINTLRSFLVPVLKSDDVFFEMAMG